MQIDKAFFGKLSAGTGRWLLLVIAAVAAWWLVDAAVHPMIKAAPGAKTLSALIGYGLVATLVCFMRWSPLQPLLAPLFDEIVVLARIAKTGSELVETKSHEGEVKTVAVKVEPMVRAGAMVAVAIYGGLTFSAIVLGGSMLAGVAH